MFKETLSGDELYNRSFLDTDSRTTLFRTLSNLFTPVMIRKALVAKELISRAISALTGQVSDPYDNGHNETIEKSELRCSAECFRAPDGFYKSPEHSPC